MKIGDAIPDECEMYTSEGRYMGTWGFVRAANMVCAIEMVQVDLLRSQALPETVLVGGGKEVPFIDALHWGGHRHSRATSQLDPDVLQQFDELEKLRMHAMAERDRHARECTPEKIETAPRFNDREFGF